MLNHNSIQLYSRHQISWIDFVPICNFTQQFCPFGRLYNQIRKSLIIITREFAAIGNNLNQIAAFFNSGGLPSHVMRENINHAISCIFEMREQVAEMAGKNYGNLKAYRK